MKANWLIQRDYEAVADNRLPQLNPRTGNVEGLNLPFKHVDIFGPRMSEPPNRSELPLLFVIADDDGNIYYYGAANEKAEFEPLDMYGRPNAGATMIAYKRGTKWDVL